MEKDCYDRKQERILTLYTKLLEGNILDKRAEAESFHISMRSLQRDIDDLRTFLANRSVKTGVLQLIVYDKKLKGYRLTDCEGRKMTRGEILAVCKILLESRAFIKEELSPIIKKLLDNCSSPENKKMLSNMIANEQFHYIEPRHRTRFVERLWEIGMAVQEHKYIQITYIKLNREAVTRLVQPVGIMFSEFYFYLTAFIEDIDREAEFENKDDIFPTIYRIDRIQRLVTTDRSFSIPYKDRFEEGEFRKRVQFMYGGKLQRITFEYSGPSLEAVQDRLPTAEVISEKDGVYTITAEVFGKGIDMWIRSQGGAVKLITRN